MDPKIVRRIKNNPKQSIDDARRGSKSELENLANCWQEIGSKKFRLQSLNLFLQHLDGSKVPETDIAKAGIIQYAFLAFIALNKIGDILSGNSEYVNEIFRAWPGMFKWSSFLYTTRIESGSIANLDASQRKKNAELITRSWCSICRDGRIRELIASSPGSIELATKLWILEDGTSSNPFGAATLEHLLRMAGKETLDRVLYAVGGEPDKIAKLALLRLRASFQKPKIESISIIVHAELLNQLSCEADHPFRNALLSAHVIKIITKALCAIAGQINRPGNEALIEPMISCFIYLRNCLDSTDGYPWVTKSIQSGLLTVFVDCSPHYSKLTEIDRQMVFSIIQNIVTRYMVYRSVITAVSSGLLHAQRSPQHARMSTSVAKDVWSDFCDLVNERQLVKAQASALKSKSRICDNVDCNKPWYQNNVQECAACQTTYYCSKECQIHAWKEGDHKTVCKLKQQERVENKLDSLSKTDSQFFHFLGPHDAHRHLPYLLKLASREFPAVPLLQLVVCIDYTEIPEKYSLRKIGDFTRDLYGSSSAVARNHAILERAKNYPEKHTIVESTIPNGQKEMLIVSLMKAGFWEGWDWRVDPEDLVDEDGNMDEAGVKMVRKFLNNFLRSRGEEETF